MKFLTTRFVIVDWGIIQEHALERLLVAKGTFWVHPDITRRTLADVERMEAMQ